MPDTWGQMLVVPPEQRFAGVTGHAPLAPSYVPEPEQPAPPFFQAPPGIDPDTGTTIGAAFGLNNDVVAGVDLLTRPAFKPDPTYDVANDAEVTGPDSKYGQYHLDRFVGVQSKDEAHAVMSRIDREEAMQATLARSGWAGILATLAAGALSPTTAIPLGGWLADAARFGRAGVIGVRALEGAAIAGGGVATQEAILQRAQETRSVAQSFWNIGGASILGGILGGAVSSLTLSRLVKSVGGDLAANPVPRAASAGAAAVGDIRGSGELAGSLGVAETLSRLTPGLRTQTSALEATRNTVRDLATGEQLAENTQGIPSSLGGSAEAQAKAAQGPLGDSMEQMRSLYSDYFFGKQVPLSPTAAAAARLAGRGNGKLSFEEFAQAVGDAQRAGDVHAIPQVEAAAKFLRENVYNPLRDEAMNVIPGFREMVEAGSADIGYLTRIWNRLAVNVGRDELRGILADHFGAVQAAMPGAAQMTRQELMSAAEDTIAQIMGEAPGRMSLPKDFNVGKAGPLKERSLASLPTNAVLKFVERNAETIAQFYTRTLAPDIALAKKFGSIDLKEQFQKIRDEQTARGRDQTPQIRARLKKQADSDIRDLSAMRDRLRGKYRLPDNPEGLLHRGVVAAKTLSFLSTLGNMTLSSASDIAKPVFIHGLTRTMGTAFAPLVHGLAKYRLAAKEVKLAGTALDMIANDRALAFTDLIDEYGRNTAVERGMHHATRAFSIATLMAPWNAVWKQFAGIITQTRALQGIEALATGKPLSTKEIAYLASGGIDRNMADRIYKQFAGSQSAPSVKLYRGVVPLHAKDDVGSFYSSERSVADAYATPAGRVFEESATFSNLLTVKDWMEAKAKLGLPTSATMQELIKGAKAVGYDGVSYKGQWPGKEYIVLDRSVFRQQQPPQAAGHGTKDGAIWNANTRDWTDRQAVSALRSLINRDVDRIIVTPGIGDKSLWMSGDLGSTIGQFQSFAIASIQKTLVSGLQQRDMAVLNGSLLMLALGAFSYWSKTLLAGQKPSNDPRVWAAEAVDQSGILGILMNGDHIIEKWTGDHVGVSALTGQPARRYTNVNAIGSTFGPIAGRLFDLADLSRAIASGQITASDAGKIRRLLPLQNLFYIRWLFDSAENGAVHALGIPARKLN